MATPSDTAVLRELARDLDGAFGAFVQAHATDVYSAALRLSGSAADADDIAQDTFVRAYRALRRFDAQRLATLEPRPWLLTITLNLWRNRLRAAARRPRTAPAGTGRDAVDGRPGPEALAVQADARRTLVGMLGELPEHHRVPVVLRHVVGLSYAEMAAVLACPEGTVKANVARGLDRLRTLDAAPDDAPRPGRRSPGPRRTGTRAVDTHRKEVR